MARLVDYLSFFIFSGMIASFTPCFIDLYYYLLFALCTPILWIPIEALLLSLFGTTPGKSLFGIKVLDKTGRKLNFLKSIKVVASFGLGTTLVRQASLSFKRRMTALIIILGCTILSLFGNGIAQWSIGISKGISNAGWVEYSDGDFRFKVHFPNRPEQESKQLIIPNADKTLDYQEIKAHQNKEVYYSVMHMELPRKWKIAGASTLLKASLDILIKHMPGTMLIDKEFTTHQTHRALDFSLDQGDQKVKGRLILVGTTLYKLTVVYPHAIEEELQDNPFLESFDLSMN